MKQGKIDIDELHELWCKKTCGDARQMIQRGDYASTIYLHTQVWHPKDTKGIPTAVCLN